MGQIDLVGETGDLSYLETAEEGLERIDTLVPNLGEPAETGEFVAEPEPVDLETVARDVWTHVEPVPPRSR